MLLNRRVWTQNKFSQSQRKHESQFVFPAATRDEDVIDSPHNINAVKSAVDIIKKSLLEFDYNLDDSFCDAQALKHSWRLPDVLLTFIPV